MEDWVVKLIKRLEAEAAGPSDIPLDRLRVIGMLDEHGEVTGHLHRWQAFLAIHKVKRSPDQRMIEVFRCLKPLFGMPQGSIVDVLRNSMIDLLRSGKKSSLVIMIFA